MYLSDYIDISFVLQRGIERRTGEDSSCRNVASRSDNRHVFFLRPNAIGRPSTGLGFSIEGASIGPSVTGSLNMRSFLAAACASLAIALLAAVILDSVFQESATKAFSKSEVRD